MPSTLPDFLLSVTNCSVNTELIYSAFHNHTGAILERAKITIQETLSLSLILAPDLHNFL
jgi:hypothetical protein